MIIDGAVRMRRPPACAVVMASVTSTRRSAVRPGLMGQSLMGRMIQRVRGSAPPGVHYAAHARIPSRAPSVAARLVSRRANDGNVEAVHGAGWAVARREDRLARDSRVDERDADHADQLQRMA